MGSLSGPAPLPGRAQTVAAKAKKYNIPDWLLWGVWGIETSFGTNVKTSSAGAMGEFQFLPSTAGSYRYPLTNTPNDQQFDQQADAAAHYLSDLIKQHGGSQDAALRAYSGGGYGLSDVQKKAGNVFSKGSLDAAGAASGIDPAAAAGAAASGVTDAATATADAVGKLAGTLGLVFSLRGLELLAAIILGVLALRTLGGHLAGS